MKHCVSQAKDVYLMYNPNCLSTFVQRNAKSLFIPRMQCVEDNEDSINNEEQEIEHLIEQIECKVCSKQFPVKSILIHIARAKKCKNSYPPIELDNLKLRCKAHYHEKKNKKLRLTYDKNKRSVQKQEEQIKEDWKTQISAFRKECSLGPIFPCICCIRELPQRGVRPVSMKTYDHLFSKNLDKYVRFDDKLKVNGIHHLCVNCCRLLLLSEMPAISHYNGLGFTNPPEKLTMLENQLLALNLIFLKIRKLPKTRMHANNDRLINVPIPDDDFIKSISQLPRSTHESGLISVRLKRQMHQKSIYREEMVRPKVIFKYLNYLKKHHPSYKDIEIKSHNFVDQEIEETVMEAVDKNNDDENIDTEVDSSDDESTFVQVTSLQPEQIQNNVMVNTTGDTIFKKTSKESPISYEYAPGEGKVPSNFLRSEDIDTTGFVRYHCDGKYGWKYEREKKLSGSQYFSTRVMQYLLPFGEDPDYIFVAQQIVERLSVENKINVCMQKGKLVKDGDGINVMQVEEGYNVFKTIPGTPAYWKQFRNETFAKMEQLGPFHLFFTLSCAETKWPEIMASILRKKGHDISFACDPWDGKDESVLVDGMPLPMFKDNHIKDLSSFYKDHFVLITRMFNDRVKGFIKNVFNKHPIEFYTYRVEFQVRGMPHIHGVAWFKKEAMVDYLSEDGSFDDTKMPELIDQWISCSLTNENPVLNEAVQQFNVHHHTKSCKKWSGECRFNFPRLPSKKTIIAKSPSLEIPEDLRKKMLSDAKGLLKKVQKKLDNITPEEEALSLEEFLKLIDISLEDYEQCLQMSQRGKCVILKRSLKERYVNNYHPFFLLAWFANCDFQFCLDSYAVITYISDYLSKDDTGLTKILREALKETCISDDFERLNYLKKIYFTHRQVCLSEAVYRLLTTLDMKGSNIGTKFIQTGFPRNRTSYLKKLPSNENDGDGSEEQDTNDNGEDVAFHITGRDGKFMKTKSLHTKYSERPKVVENMCFAEFCSFYETSPKPKKECNINSNESYPPKLLPLQDGSYMRRRNQRLVLQIHSSDRKESLHEEAYSELLLFFPWRNEETDLFLQSETSCKKLYKDNEESILRNKKTIFPFKDRVCEMKDFLESEEDFAPQHVGDTLDNETEQQNMDDSEQLENLDTSELPEEELGKVKQKGSDGPRVQRITLDDDFTMRENARRLSKEQKIAFDLVMDYCQKLKASKGKPKFIPDAPKIIIHGKHFLLLKTCIQ